MTAKAWTNEKNGHRKTDGHLYMDFVDPKLVSE